MAIDYATPGVFTGLPADLRALADDLTAEPVSLCAAASGLVLHPFDAEPLGLPEKRLAARAIRPAAEILAEALALDPAPLATSRPPERRAVGTCRNFVTVAVALLRARGIPARARCGFATYFDQDRGVDHWIAEYHDGHRWVRVDVQHLGMPRSEDLAPGAFLTGGEAWSLVRDGGADPMTFGVPRTAHAWGPAEIRGNAIRDLAALVKVETLPWDEWGRMTASYQGETGPDYDALIDSVAEVCAGDDQAAVEARYGSEDLAVPDELLT
jgi:hypothetical protein